MKVFQWQFLHPRFWPSWLGLLFMRLTIYLPIKIQLWLGNIIGAVMGGVLKDRMKIAQRNLELCFPELNPEQRAELLKRNQQEMGMLLIETALSWWASDEQLRKRVRYEGFEHIDQALAKGKGIILLTGHFTSMEIGGRLFTLKNSGYVFVRPMKNALFNAVMMNARKRSGEGIILRDDPRSMIKILRKGKIIWYAPDQDFGKNRSIYVSFFGVPAATISATGKIAKITEAAVILFVPKREADGSYTLTCKPALTDFPLGDNDKDTQRINDIIESEIRKMPEQYVWIHRRFKSQPNRKKGAIYKEPLG